jgi:hypothetical protein
MNSSMITAADRRMARVCLSCPACKHARKAQKGLLFELVRRIEGRICPFCRAYEKVYGRKAHEAIDPSSLTDSNG